MEHHRDFNDSIINAANYLQFQLRISITSVENYKRAWRRLRSFMDLNNIKSYDYNVGELFIFHEFNARNKNELSAHEKRVHFSISVLNEFKTKGIISIHRRLPKTSNVFSGPIGDLCTSFLKHKKQEERCSPETIEIYRNNLSRFIDYCNKHVIASIQEIDLAVLLYFICEVENIRQHRNGSHITALKGILRYAFEQKLLEIDFSLNMPKYRAVKQPQLPSVYSEDEIVQLLSSIERSSAVGKRDYAILLIAVRLGFRAFDIANLKFENINWDKCTIEIKQHKTGKEMVAPMLPDVGNAIIDYLKYGRPQSDAPNLFLRARPPYDQLRDGKIVVLIARAAFIRSGIDIKGRKHGAHSLRHSLVAQMLEKSTVLPVISEVLGHKDMQSTKYYLRIDIKSMLECVLDVPPVPTSFYEQKGDAFYD